MFVHELADSIHDVACNTPLHDSACRPRVILPTAAGALATYSFSQFATFKPIALPVLGYGQSSPTGSHMLASCRRGPADPKPGHWRRLKI